LKLNFNRAGDFHPTHYTAIVSLFIRLAIGFYVYVTVKKLVYKEGDLNSSSVLPVSLKELGPIDYMSSGLKIFHVVEK
jgi:hypothetical protein